MHIHDLIGIGFGPSNIALAIALDEQRQAGQAKDALFIERQPCFAWHPHMLLDNAHMQISFLKDLVTPRNPGSRFSFLNYLHSKGRLQDFINLQTFFPSRHEGIGSQAGPEGVELNVRDLETGHTESTRYDAVVLATGYVRDTHKQILAPVAD